MTVSDTISKLDDYEDEDIFDVVTKLEKSFGLKFENDAFYNIRTFGDLCDVFEKYLKYELSEFGYIEYFPSFNPLILSRIHLPD